MQFSTVFAIFAATMVAAAPTSPMDSSLEARKDPGAIAACETQTAADQVACIDKCNKDAACITACSLDAAQKYTACATN
ncbi:hypothetical protein CABS01_03063 [Colletotrichum abscissum]|uniref:Uncharacterized protein n=1 Tax=Colletotrichum abscissum TaxID=1671311 RepID=A0A9P9X814_9PEZI|nr:uncharacterized protein CABS01_03063 [Colletotrichum abscissum]KAI3541364.1 hypothetical protein CABS02_10758 [Colletotrichum abscissum]KAK1477761.1 hypothetical protein CABS01_03063 [Colletotrichum abscissum]